MTTTPPFDDSFDKLFPYVEQCFSCSRVPDNSLVNYFLNTANVNQIPEQTPYPSHDATPLDSSDESLQGFIYPSSFQPDSAVKETFMQNSFSNYNSTDNGLASHSPSSYGAVNQSPELRSVSEPSPSTGTYRENVVSINSATDGARQIAALFSQLKLMRRQIGDLTEDLQVAKAEIRAAKQGNQHMDERMLRFEQKHQQAAIQQSKLRFAQEQQLERRLRQSFEDTVRMAVHSAMERFMQVPRTVPEPARQPSSHSVPKRQNKGIYS